MKMLEIRAIAKRLDIKTSRMSKLNLIREIQTTEGNSPCFSTPQAGECDQTVCIWREDCLALARKQAVAA